MEMEVRTMSNIETSTADVTSKIEEAFNERYFGESSDPAVVSDMDQTCVSPYGPAAYEKPQSEAGHTTAPDHLTKSTKKRLAFPGRLHTSGELWFDLKTVCWSLVLIGTKERPSSPEQTTTTDTIEYKLHRQCTQYYAHDSCDNMHTGHAK